MTAPHEHDFQRNRLGYLECRICQVLLEDMPDPEELAVAQAIVRHGWLPITPPTEGETA